MPYEDDPKSLGSVRGGPRVRYGGGNFAEAAKLPIVEGGFRDPRDLAQLLGGIIRRPRRLRALVSLLLGLPRLELSLSESISGKALQAYLSQTRLGFVPRHRLCQPVLGIPDSYDEYLRGRTRQAVRTNLRRANEAGISCNLMTSPTEKVAAWERVTLERGLSTWLDSWRAGLSLPGVDHFVARAPDGSCLATAAVNIDDEVALIEAAVASSHLARWSLHAHIVEELCRRRVRHLLVTGGGVLGALSLPAESQYFQRLLGYELFNIGLSVRSGADKHD